MGVEILINIKKHVTGLVAIPLDSLRRCLILDTRDQSSCEL